MDGTDQKEAHRRRLHSVNFLTYRNHLMVSATVAVLMLCSSITVRNERRPHPGPKAAQPGIYPKGLNQSSPVDYYRCDTAPASGLCRRMSASRPLTRRWAVREGLATQRRPTPPTPNEATTSATDCARMRSKAKAAVERVSTQGRYARAAQERVNALTKQKRR